MREEVMKYGIEVNKIHDDCWSFGLCVSHTSGIESETYLYINLFKFSISIGKFQTWKEGE